MLKQGPVHSFFLLLIDPDVEFTENLKKVIFEGTPKGDRGHEQTWEKSTPGRAIRRGEDLRHKFARCTSSLCETFSSRCNINVCFLMTKPFQRERENGQQTLKQSSYRSLWLTKEFIAFTYRSKGKRQLTESRMIQRQFATLKIPPQPGWQLTKTAILECNMTDRQTGGTSNQRAQHD